MKLKLNQIMVGGFNDQILSDLRDIYGEIGEEVSGGEFYDEYGDEIGEKGTW